MKPVTEVSDLSSQDLLHGSMPFRGTTHEQPLPGGIGHPCLGAGGGLRTIAGELPDPAGRHRPDLGAARWAGLRVLRGTPGDGSEAFAVTISDSSPFEPNRRNRAEPTSIAGHQGHWYRSEIAGQDVIARETLVEVDGGKVAHISLRAADETQKAQAMRQVQALRFEDARLSSN